MSDHPSQESSTDTKTGAAQSFRELLEKTFLLGIGAAAITKDRIQELVDEFVRRGQLSGEEGRDMVERLATRSKEEARSVLKRADSSLQSALRELGFVTKKDFDELALRLEQLEHRLSLLEVEGDKGSASSPTP